MRKLLLVGLLILPTSGCATLLGFDPDKVAEDTVRKITESTSTGEMQKAFSGGIQKILIGEGLRVAQDAGTAALGGFMTGGPGGALAAIPGAVKESLTRNGLDLIGKVGEMAQTIPQPPAPGKPEEEDNGLLYALMTGLAAVLVVINQYVANARQSKKLQNGAPKPEGT